MSDQTSPSCWLCKCDCGYNDILCPLCKVIQPPSQANHFVIFNINNAFEIDIAALEQSYFALQKQLHPDRFTGASSEEKILSLQQTTSINEAYDILKKPLKRAEYILSLQGIIINSENDNIKPDHDILIKTMEYREILAEISTLEDIKNLIIQFNKYKTDIIKSLSTAFADNKFQNAAQLTISLQYIEKSLQTAKLKKQQLRDNNAST